MSLADIDPRTLLALRALRVGDYSYIKGVSKPPDLVTSFARDLGYPKSWGDPSLLPAYGGPTANNAWKAIGVTNRAGLGGLPCEIVHNGIASSCTANSAMRGFKAFGEALAIYIPVGLLQFFYGLKGYLLY